MPHRTATYSGRTHHSVSTRHVVFHSNILDLPVELCGMIAPLVGLVELVQELRFDYVRARGAGAQAIFRRHVRDVRAEFGILDSRVSDLRWEANKVLRALSSSTQLTSLHWKPDYSSADLEKPSSQAFPALRELSICPHPGANFSYFGFLALPSLVRLKYEDIIPEGPSYGDDDDPVANMADALRLIEPCESLLESFTLRLSSTIDHEPEEEEEEDCWRPYRARYADDSDASSISDWYASLEVLSEAINGLRLPKLTSVALNIEIQSIPRSDFRPFLEAHPQLQHVEFPFVDWSLQDFCLPSLESFTGTPRDCYTILNGKRPLQSLTVWLSASHWDLSFYQKDHGRKTRDTESLLGKLANTPTLKKLSLIISPDRGRKVDYLPVHLNGRFKPSHVRRIVQACPHLTYLELTTTEDLDGLLAALQDLHDLQSLTLTIKTDYDDLWKASEKHKLDSDGEELCWLPPRDGLRFFADGFPVERCKSALETSLVPVMPQLKNAELRIRVWSAGSDDDGDYSRPADILVNHLFEIHRDKAGVVTSVSGTTHELES